MNTQIRQCPLLSAIFFVIVQHNGLGSDIEFNKIAKFLREPSERKSILEPYVEHQNHTVIGASSDHTGGVRISGMLLTGNNNVSFRDLEGRAMPLLFSPTPDPKVLLEASTLDDLLSKFLPKDAPEEQKLHLRKINDIETKKLIISDPSIAYEDSVSGFFLDGNRLVGVKCHIVYFGGRTKLDGDYKIGLISLDVWYSADLSFWK